MSRKSVQIQTIFMACLHMQTDAAARDRYAKAAQKYVSEHMATHGDPRKKMLAIPLVLVGSAAIFMSIFNGVRVLMSSGCLSLVRNERLNICFHLPDLIPAPYYIPLQSRILTWQAHSLTQGGMLWFTDLTSPDPYHGLPILCAAATMGMVKFGMNLGSEESSPMAGSNAQQAKILRWVELVVIFVGLQAVWLWCASRLLYSPAGCAMAGAGQCIMCEQEWASDMMRIL
eukprot:1140422-Pelagomonas_calceolata.AAC.5